MTLATRLFTWMRGELVGTDAGGNRYFRDKKAAAVRRERRWVLYAGEAEASRVPPEWHSWLHHTTNVLPTETDHSRQPWQKDHVRNLTGTADAYRPPGHILKGGRRDRATGDYEPWQPP